MGFGEGLGAALSGAGAAVQQGTQNLTNMATQERLRPIQDNQVALAQQSLHDLTTTTPVDQWVASNPAVKYMIPMAQQAGLLEPGQKDISIAKQKELAKHFYDNPALMKNATDAALNEMRGKEQSFKSEIDATQKALSGLQNGIDDDKIQRLQEKLADLKGRQKPFTDQVGQLSTASSQADILHTQKIVGNMPKEDQELYNTGSAVAGRPLTLPEFAQQKAQKKADESITSDQKNFEATHAGMKAKRGTDEYGKSLDAFMTKNKTAAAQVIVSGREEMQKQQMTAVWDSSAKASKFVSKEEAMKNPNYKPMGSPEARQEMPTADLLNMKQAAPTVLNFVDKIKKNITDAEKDGLGPVDSRWREFAAGKIGASDKTFTALRTNVTLLETRLMKMHVGSRGSDTMLAHFREILNYAKQSPDNMRTALGEIEDYANEVKGMKSINVGGGADSPATTLPPEALKQLQSGHNTTFGNGQVWTLDPSGKPLQVK